MKKTQLKILKYPFNYESHICRMIFFNQEKKLYFVKAAKEQIYTWSVSKKQFLNQRTKRINKDYKCACQKRDGAGRWQCSSITLVSIAAVGRTQVKGRTAAEILTFDNIFAPLFGASTTLGIQRSSPTWNCLLKLGTCTL